MFERLEKILGEILSLADVQEAMAGAAPESRRSVA